MITKFEDVPPCDCVVITSTSEPGEIEFCALHSAAVAMFTALKKLGPILTPGVSNSRQLQDALGMVFGALREVDKFNE